MNTQLRRHEFQPRYGHPREGCGDPFEISPIRTPEADGKRDAYISICIRKIVILSVAEWTRGTRWSGFEKGDWSVKTSAGPLTRFRFSARGIARGTPTPERKSRGHYTAIGLSRPFLKKPHAISFLASGFLATRSISPWPSTPRENMFPPPRPLSFSSHH